MNVTGYITRAELGLANLVISSGNYRLLADGMDFGPTIWSRQEARSSFVHGAVPVNQIKDNTAISMGVRVLGASQAWLSTNLDALIKAVSQWTYQVNITMDGTAYTWQCFSADYAVGAMDARFDLLDVNVNLIIPRKPTPVVGPV